MRAAAEEAGVTESNWVAVSALAAAREHGSVPDDQARVLEELQALRRLVVVYGGRLVEAAETQSGGRGGSRVDAAGRALEVVAARLTGLLDDVGEARARQR